MLRRSMPNHFHHLPERCWFLLRWKRRWRRSDSGWRSVSGRGVSIEAAIGVRCMVSPDCARGRI